MRSWVCSLLVALAMEGAMGMAEPLLEHAKVFTHGESGYKIFRIPAVETAPDGSLIAFAEARKNGPGDPGWEGQDIDLVCKRSADNGRTWSAMTVIEDPGELWSAANPATVVDRDTGRVWLLYLRCKPGCSSHKSRPGTEDMQTFARHSDDNGATWSEPTDLTRVARDMGDPQWQSSVVGPGGGIQTRTGRLAFAAWKHPFAVFALYSDDHGATWKRGQFVPDCRGNENQLVELADGRILMDIRQCDGPHRWLATSADGGETWSAPRPGVAVTPVCCAIERCPPASGDRNRILWTGPAGPKRSNLVVRVSSDEGETFPGERRVLDGEAAYSDLTILKDRTVGILWEHQGILFTRLGLDFLK